eukprot:307792-Pleurochrysis_carterae.AAC.1
MCSEGERGGDAVPEGRPPSSSRPMSESLSAERLVPPACWPDDGSEGKAWLLESGAEGDAGVFDEAGPASLGVGLGMGFAGSSLDVGVEAAAESAAVRAG